MLAETEKREMLRLHKLYLNHKKGGKKFDLGYLHNFSDEEKEILKRERPYQPRKKYKLVEHFDELGNCFHYRVVALRNFGFVKKGDIGGFVHSEKNLSHTGTCWIYGNAGAYNNSRVEEDAKLYDKSRALGSAVIKGNACLSDYACALQGSVMKGSASLRGFSHIFGDSVFEGNASAEGSVRIAGTAHVKGGTFRGQTSIKSGTISGEHEIITVGPVGKSSAYITYNKTDDTVCRGCFYGSLDEFEQAVKEKYKNIPEYLNGYKEVIAMLKAIREERRKELCCENC